MTINDFLTIIPISVLVVGASILLLIEAFLPTGKKSLVAGISALLFLGLFVYSFLPQPELIGFGGMVIQDGFSAFLTKLFLLTGLLASLVSFGYNQRASIDKGEFYALMIFSLSGMILMAQATDLIITFLALELLSIPLYILAAFKKDEARSEEAGVKYFLLGAYASGFIVFGIALIFGATGSTSFIHIAEAVKSGVANISLMLAGGGLLLVGFGFKVASVPFHMWTPDVYEGAPTSVTTFMAAGAKVAGFAALFRVLATLYPTMATDLMPIMATLSALTMIVGNVVAVAQKNIKRMLAYSSIAQAGYILMAFVPFGNPAIQTVAISAGLFYLVAYTITSFGSWGMVMMIEKADGSGLEIEDYAGMGKKHPMLAIAMTIFMLSLTGLPPTLGLIGKVYLFRAVVEGQLYWLALIGVVTSLISAFYYLRVIVVMYMKQGEPIAHEDAWLKWTIAFCAVLVVGFSFFPQALFDQAVSAIVKLF